MVRHAFALILIFSSQLAFSQTKDLGGKVFKLFENHCAKCHGPDSPGKGGFSEILDFKSLRDSKFYVNADDLENSEIYSQVSLDFMPEDSDPLSTAQKNLIASWILAGAPDPEEDTSLNVGKKQVEEAALKYVKSLDSRDRPFIRFFSFIHLRSLNLENDLYFQALSKLLNSLSQNREIVKPTALEGLNNQAFAIDIRDYKWSKETWHSVTLDFPFHTHTAIVDQIIGETDSITPIVHGDWFLQTASFEPNYGLLVGHPQSLDELETQLGIDRKKNIENFSVARSGFLDSGVSHNNRMIERHPLPKNAGAYWISYDFNASSGVKSLLDNPFGPFGLHSSDKNFVHDGGEVIYNLPNGMQAYLLVTADGKILREAPVEIVEDTDPRRSTIFNGASCFSCHSDGMRKNYDVIRQNSTGDAFSAQEISSIEKLYPSRDKMEALFNKDDETYQTALSKADVPVVGQLDDQINRFIFLQEDRVRLPQIVDMLGVTETALNQAVKTKADFFLQKIIEVAKDRGLNQKKLIGVFPRLGSLFQIPTRVSDLEAEILTAQNGDKILLAEGVYQIDFTKPKRFLNSGFEVIGVNAERVEFSNLRAELAIGEENTIKFSNFNIKNYRSNFLNLISGNLILERAIIENLECENCPQGSPTFVQTPRSATKVRSLTIRNSRFTNVSPTAVGFYSKIDFFNSSFTRIIMRGVSAQQRKIRHCVFEDSLVEVNKGPNDTFEKNKFIDMPVAF